MDLFGGEDSTNAAEAFAMGLKGRYRESDGIYKDPKALNAEYRLEVPTDDGKLEEKDIPLRRAMNAVLLDAYVADCTRICQRWNRELKKLGVTEEINLPNRKFNRQQGVYAGYRFNPAGEIIDEATWTKEHTSWLPTKADREYVDSCMVKVTEPGKFANYIAPPQKGPNNQPVDFEYVKFH
jgi:benzoyl-CoA 2,3-dioxygenase component B